MDFTELIAYIKRAGRQVLTFFPSKTDMVSIADADGNPTEETLKERLGYIKDNMDTFTKKTNGQVELKDAPDEIKTKYQYVGEEASVTSGSCYAIVSKSYIKNDVFYLTKSVTLKSGSLGSRFFQGGYYRYTRDTKGSYLYDFSTSKAYYEYIGNEYKVDVTDTVACTLKEKIKTLNEGLEEMTTGQALFRENVSELVLRTNAIEVKNRQTDQDISALKETAETTETKEKLYDRLVSDLQLEGAYKEVEVKIVTVSLVDRGDALVTTTEIEIGSYFYMEKHTLSYAGIQKDVPAGYYKVTDNHYEEDIGYVLYAHSSIAFAYKECASYAAATLEELKEVAKVPLPVYSLKEGEDSLEVRISKIEKTLKEEMEALKKSGSDGKTSVAAAITAAGVQTAADASFATMAANIANINFRG